MAQAQTSATVCTDVSLIFSGTLSGGPEELVVNSLDEDVHEAEIGSSDCIPANLEARLRSDDPLADLDLRILWEGSDVAYVASEFANETAILDGQPHVADDEATEGLGPTLGAHPYWGTYTFHVEAFLALGTPYDLTVNAEMTALPATSSLPIPSGLPFTPILPFPLPNGDTPDEPSVVVAVVDTGINPYHDEFSQGTFPGTADLTAHPSTYVDEYPAGVGALDLTLDAATYEDAVAADQATWEGVAPGTLHWIPGTKIIGAYCGGDPANSAISSVPHCILDDDEVDEDEDPLASDGHGTLSAGVAVGNTTGSCARCLLVVVEGSGGLNWALSQPWIDIVTNSWGTRGNIGVPGLGVAHVDPLGAFGGGRTAKNTRAAVTRGQTVLFAAGNGFENAFITPEPTLESETAGPDWVVTVGAIFKFEDEENPNCDCPEDEGSIIGSGKPVDVSSYGLGPIPGPQNETISGLEDHSGTSAASPIVAGVMADVLLHARVLLGDSVGGSRDGIVADGSGSGFLADGGLTRAELEAVVKNTAEHTSSVWLSFPLTVPTTLVPEEAAWSQWAIEGWGVVASRTGESAKEALDGTPTLAPRPMDELFAAHDRQLRQALWGP